MSLTIHLPAVLAPLANYQRTLAYSLPAEESTLRDVVKSLGTDYPELGPRLQDAAGEPYPFVTFFVNDEDIRFTGGFDSRVRVGDEVVIVPAVAGG